MDLRTRRIIEFGWIAISLLILAVCLVFHLPLVIRIILAGVLPCTYSLLWIINLNGNGLNWLFNDAELSLSSIVGLYLNLIVLFFLIGSYAMAIFFAIVAIIPLLNLYQYLKSQKSEN